MPGLTFQIAAASANNSLRIDGAAGTLTLTTPQPCREVMVMATKGNGSTDPMYDGRDAAQGWSAADNSAGTCYYQIDYTDCVGATQSYRNWVEVIK